MWDPAPALEVLGSCCLNAILNTYGQLIIIFMRCLIYDRKYFLPGLETRLRRRENEGGTLPMFYFINRGTIAYIYHLSPSF